MRLRRTALLNKKSNVKVTRRWQESDKTGSRAGNYIQNDISLLSPLA